MRVVIALIACLASTSALAQSAGSCQLLSEEKFARVWQCQPTPPSGHDAQLSDAANSPAHGVSDVSSSIPRRAATPLV